MTGDSLRAARRTQCGATAIEFALVSAFIFFPLLLGITSFGRWVYTLNAASEATRFGARVAVVCDLGDTAIRKRMQTFLPQAADANIVITYSPPSCSIANCETVTVSLTDLSINSLFWFAPPGSASMLPEYPIPAFSHTLSRESMRSAIDGSPNPLCNG